VHISMVEGMAPVRHPGILGLTDTELNHDDVTTAHHHSISVASAGVIRPASGTKDVQRTALGQPTTCAMARPPDPLLMPGDPSSLLAGYAPSGTPFVIAARIAGTFHSAFPERKDSGGLAESKEPGQIIVVADTDIISDRLWVQIRPFFGQQIMNAFANNGD